MKLISSLGSYSIPSRVGGELRMFFTILEPGAIDSNGVWQKKPDSGLSIVYQLSSQDKVTMDIVPDTSDQGGVFGRILFVVTMSAKLANGKSNGGLVTGTLVGTPVFLPGKPQVCLQRGQLDKAGGPPTALTCQLGYNVTFSWDGNWGSCVGSWWANWTP